MASYKVPQDVEADDKLIGPFSFRQFIYLIIVVAGMAIAWVLGNLFLPLAVLPLPIILFFGALALPLRKDQPMETYLAAIVSFYLKPHKRLWDPDGQQALIEIVSSKNNNDHPALKDLSQDEADKRFSYLAGIVDSQGWAVRGVDPSANSPMTTDAFIEAQQAEDVMDQSSRTAQIIDDRIEKANQHHREELIARMQAPQPALQQQQTSQIQQPIVAPQQMPPVNPGTAPTDDPHLTINPYPSQIHQTVIQPLSATPQVTPANSALQPEDTQTASAKPLSPDIINLANNPDLSIETIAREAGRIQRRHDEDEGEEVIISLR